MWIQHELATAERNILGRSPDEYTATVGYAGSTARGKDGKVCYHNTERDSDYGELGHSEAVQLILPSDRVGDFAEPFFELFINGERADPQVSVRRSNGNFFTE